MRVTAATRCRARSTSLRCIEAFRRCRASLGDSSGHPCFTGPKYVNILTKHFLRISKEQTFMSDRAASNHIARMELGNRVFFRLYQCANLLHKTGSRAVESE